MKGTDSDFSGTLEEWDDRVFLSAVKFRVHRFSQDQKQESTGCADFAEAMRVSRVVLKAGYRVIVYAVTDTGRYQALVPERWEHYAALYNDAKSKRGK